MKRAMIVLPLLLSIGCAQINYGLEGTNDPVKLDLSDSALQVQVNSLSSEIAALRGLAFKQPVKASFVNRAHLPALIDSIEAATNPGEAGPDDLTFGQLAYGLGYTASPASYDSAENSFSGSAIVGFYVPGTNHLWIVSEASSQDQRSTMAHELVHALQDQNFDLAKDRSTSLDGMYAHNMVVEGDAEYTQMLYDRRNPSLSLIDADNDFQNMTELADLLDQSTYGKLPLVNTLPGFLPYYWGPKFVHEVRRAKGWAGVDLLHETPPATTHHVLYPAQGIGHAPYRTWDTTRTWSAMNRLEGWANMGFDQMGELMLNTLLMSMNRKVMGNSGSAVEGWNGDQVWLWRKDSQRYAAAAIIDWQSRSQAAGFKQYWDMRVSGLGNRISRSDTTGTRVLLAWGHLTAPEMDSLWKDLKDTTSSRLVAGRVAPVKLWPKRPAHPWGPRPPRF
jgi:hypothetical protein